LPIGRGHGILENQKGVMACSKFFMHCSRSAQNYDKTDCAIFDMEEEIA
jgi:hypothetical protein